MDNKITDSKYSWAINEEYVTKGIMPNKILGIKEELDWMRRQSEYAIFGSKYKLRYDLKRGEIYQVDWGINVNSEFSSISYGVVVADSSPFNPLVIMCPIKCKKAFFGMTSRNSVELGLIPELKRSHPYIALVNQIRPIDKLRILRQGKTMDELNQESPELNDPSCDEPLFEEVPTLSEERVATIIKLSLNIVMEGN